MPSGERSAEEKTAAEPREVADVIAVAAEKAGPKRLTKKIYAVVCGMPRCGTSNFASLLNKYRAFEIQGELPLPLLRRVLKVMIEADGIFNKVFVKNLENWNSRRYHTIADTIASFTKGGPLRRPETELRGFKLPNAEFESEELNAVFGPSVDRVHYMYCIRNPVDCFLSLSAMPWFSQGPDAYIVRYIRSLKKICDLKVKSRSPDSKIGVTILNLDGFTASPDRAEWISKRLYRPLGVKRSRDACLKFLERVGYINSTKQATGKDRERALSPEALKQFKANEGKIQAALTRFNEMFGENLSVKLD